MGNRLRASALVKFIPDCTEEIQITSLRFVHMVNPIVYRSATAAAITQKQKLRLSLFSSKKAAVQIELQLFYLSKIFS